MSNMTAFLTTIAVSEIGLPLLGRSERGYNVIVGGSLFQSYDDHPRKEVWLPRLEIYSSAAGRYQITIKTFDAYKKMLSLSNFTPASQDIIAMQLIKERGATTDVFAGRIDIAVNKCSNIWASFPGNNYNQPEHKLEFLRKVFVNNGGILA